MSKAKIAAACLCLGLVSTALADTIADPFAGEWRVNVNPDHAASVAGQKPFSDSLLFEDETFSAEAFGMLGFAPVEYELEENDSVVVAEATLSSTDRGELLWSVRQVNGTLLGTMVWTRADGRVFTYTITGNRQSSLEFLESE